MWHLQGGCWVRKQSVLVAMEHSVPMLKPASRAQVWHNAGREVEEMKWVASVQVAQVCRQTLSE